jgi:protein ImuA
MLCAPHIAGPSEPEGTKAKRLEALREAVAGLRSVPLGGWPQTAFARPGPLQASGMPGPGLTHGGLNEILPAPGGLGAAFGFLFTLTAAALQEGRHALFIAARRALDLGAPCGHGLNGLGVDLGRLILVETKTDQEVLWAIEEALRSGARPALVAGAIEKGVDLTQSLRLNLAAAPHATPLILLRGARASGSSAALTRWRIAPAPAARDRFGAFAAWRWHVVLERCRNGRPGEWLIEWDPAVRRFQTVDKDSGHLAAPARCAASL